MMVSQGKILVVDDDAKNVKLSAALLHPRGYEVRTASNGAEALQQVQQEQPDLILLDAMMPLVDGFEVCKLLKDRPETRLIPIVMMTALGSREDRIKGIEAGADAFLTKPVHQDELLAHIRTSLRLKHAMDAAMASTRQKVLPHIPAGNAVCRQEGDYWTLAYHGTVCRLKDIKGLHYLAYLLARPGEACHVTALVTAIDQPQMPTTTATSSLSTDRSATAHVRVGGLGDAGVVLDAPAKAAYKRRLDELQADLDEAEHRHDIVRATSIQAEIDFLTAELTAAVGLGGRDRRTASGTERARLMVTKALKAALQKIHDNHPTLRHHLATSVTTGTFCTYTPDPTAPLSWLL